MARIAVSPSGRLRKPLATFAPRSTSLRDKAGVLSKEGTPGREEAVQRMGGALPHEAWFGARGRWEIARAAIKELAERARFHARRRQAAAPCSGVPLSQPRTGRSRSAATR